MQTLRYYFIFFRIIIDRLFYIERSNYDEVVAQKLLIKTYQLDENRTDFKVSLSDFGFRKYSQNGEDGILLYIFSMIGATTKKSVEICAGTCIECNTANLIINHGWESILFDGNPSNTRIGNLFYRFNKNTYSHPPTILNKWITKDNINHLVAEQGFEGEIDLLSLDMDGMDWWIWKSLKVIDPRVVVLEFNDLLGPEKCVTVPYSNSFTAKFVNGAPIYSGASLRAFVKLAKQKGYRLIGVENLGFNAFFMRNDIGKNIFPELKIEDVFFRPKTVKNLKQNSDLLKDYSWEKV